MAQIPYFKIQKRKTIFLSYVSGKANFHLKISFGYNFIKKLNTFTNSWIKPNGNAQFQLTASNRNVVFPLAIIFGTYLLCLNQVGKDWDIRSGERFRNG